MRPLLRGAILDVDGTLVDSNDAHAESWQRVLSRHGFQLSYDKIRERIGMGSDKLLPVLTGLEKDSPQGRRLADERRELFLNEYLPGLKAFPEARRLLARMREDGLRLAVATSAGQDELRGLLKLLDGEFLIDEITGADDVTHSKPDADPVEASLARLGLYPSEVLMIGDTAYDIEAAIRAGIQTIALRCGGWPDEKLQGAIAVYDSPYDLLQNYEVSPLCASDTCRLRRQGRRAG